MGIEAIIGLIGLAVSAASAGVGAAMTLSQAQARASLQQQEASYTSQTGGRQVQSQVLQQTQMLGRATAGAGASGFRGGGSMTTYLNQMANVMKANTAWTSFAAAKTAGLIGMGAQSTLTAGGLGAAGGILGGVGGAVTGMGQMGKTFNWWGPSNGAGGMGPLPNQGS